MKLVHAGLIAIGVAYSVSLAAQTGLRRDGRWDVIVEMQMPDMPGMPKGMSMPPMKSTTCVTREEAANPNSLVPPQRGSGPSDCKVSDVRTVGNKVTYSMVCTGANPMTGTGEAVYEGDSYAGNMTMNMQRGGQPMAMTMKYTGKRLGDCVKKD